MLTIQDIIRKLKQNHVINFQNPSQKVDYNWAGYSPSTGLFFVMGESFTKAENAAYEMNKYGLENWIEIDSCIDNDEEAR